MSEDPKKTHDSHHDSKPEARTDTSKPEERAGVKKSEKTVAVRGNAAAKTDSGVDYDETVRELKNDQISIFYRSNLAQGMDKQAAFEDALKSLGIAK